MQVLGTLYIVATPIGNLGDVTYRAIETLKSVSLIASEDTRTTKKLLSYYNIHTRLISYHEHNEVVRSLEILDMLRRGEDVALVSEAGTPSISDPGYRLISKVAESGVNLVPIPGPTAAVAALSVSGLPTDQFLFVGFLPDKKGKRLKRLEGIKNITATIIFYVSKWKVLGVVQDMLSVLGERRVSFCKELTKLHEETIHTNLSNLIDLLKIRAVKGEITLVVEGAEKLQ